MTSFSYKPATGSLEGASTVVPLKAGGFLEVRRGDKTRWAPGEARQTWATLDEWKATLPSDAVIQERGAYSSSCPVSCRIIEGAALPPDFLTAIIVHRRATGKDPRSTPITVENNVTVAAQWNKKADRCKDLAATFPHSAYAKIERDFRANAAAEIAKAPYERRFCRSYHWKGVNKNGFYAQRISDGEFIPIYFDMRRGLLHSPSEDVFRHIGATGDTFAALGVRPVFLVPVSNLSGRLRMISLEKPAATE